MARIKKGNLTTYSFSIDSSDAKYSNLINFLNDIDQGARSYIIRQILNNYVNGQPNHGAGLFTPAVSSTSQSTTENIITVEEVEVPEPKQKKEYPPQLGDLKSMFGG